MAVPRVFVSSTYYDLKQVRYNIGDYIKSLGYEPVMHERSGVAYSQTTPLENDCYHELASCDIIVCIIGNHFGSQSMDNELSITMKEIQTAVKSKKKVYIFISKDVFIENRTYEKNKESGTFKSAYTDDIRIHEFIFELKNNTKNNVIESFETTDDIIATLKLQFAGLFQNLLAKDASATDAKTAYDLQESADRMKDIIQDFEKQKEEFFAKFDSTILANNGVAFTIKQHLGLSKSAFFAKDLDALDEFLGVVGFTSVEVDEIFEDSRKYVKETIGRTRTIVLKQFLVAEDGTFLPIRQKSMLESGILYSDEYTTIRDDDLPF